MRAPTSEISTIPLPETYPSSMQAFGQDFVRYRATTLDQSVVSRISDMRQPQLTYHQARSMQRKFIFHAGPTNSGKTYSALKRFREANRGIYCAPLRLLALEVYDDTNNHGIPCDLVTGEDRKSGKGRPDEPQELNDSALDKLLRLPHLPKGDVASANPISLMDGDASTAAILGLDHASPKVPESIGLTLNSIFSSQAAETSSSQSDNDGGDTKATSSAQSSHVACTIEMADVDKVFDVAVIDEVQLIGDRDRGWAWTRALLGLAAHEIHVCGEPRALSIVESLLKSTGEDVQVHTYERLTPLVVAPHSINRNLANLRRGDAIIAFSRKELFRWKAEIERETRFRCAIVYGSLPPQTRAQQARLFNQPDSGFDILVATDAIGMGLNLNIGRIIFTTLQKFNGVSNVTLSPSEVRQIAGRAGRFRSKFPRGEFTTFEPEDMGILIKQFNGPADSLQAGLMANFEQLEALSKQLPGADMLDLFTKFEDLARLDKRYFMCDSSDRKEAIKLLAPLNLSFKDRYTFILAPANLENDYMRSCLLSFATGFEANRPITLAAITVPSTTSGAPSVLNEFEQCHKMLDLYMWLSYRFPQLFPDRDAAKQLQAQCAERIMEGLIEETRTGRRPKPQPRRRY
ncbi:hypothetical protein CAOG_008576 [Capsaspora owczarzaki ATCC 30864]|uniref:RNA helicase n=2 Tax=Capsaspora owczarzaki (strain ATCC 30864) TaxID=595528 RepID=A0A0D2U6N7_CAPO3|nr:hypothetical protein CAOG_008576 [Capsaspora owczarzaki ATCC 30864]